MKIQVLITTMHATDFSLVEKMNVRDADVVIANQTDVCAYAEQDFPARNVHAVLVSTNTRGAGLNRNIALAYATGDVILFADDDLLFRDESMRDVREEFLQHPEADAIKFYCESTTAECPLSFRRPAQFQKAKLRTIMSAGAPAVAARRAVLNKYDILFPISIGPGCTYGCGEDSVFIKRMMQSPMRVYLSPVLAAYVNNAPEESTWFTGYDDHYFETVGYVYAKLYGRLARLLAMRRAYKMQKDADVRHTMQQMYALMAKGIAEYEK